MINNNENVTTIDKLLEVAEELFSKKGFNGTSVNAIAEKAEVNKALIYYYFKDKDDIVNSLFENIIKASDDFICNSAQAKEINIQDKKGKIKEEIIFMQKKKKIFGIMLMESLKEDDKNSFLFQCAEKIIKCETNEMVSTDNINDKSSEEVQRYLVHEFFTGFIPIIVFILFKDKWCEYYQVDSDIITKFFLDSFQKTHLDTKLK